MRRTRLAAAVRVLFVAGALVLPTAGAPQTPTAPHVAVLHADPASLDAGGWAARGALARSFLGSHADAYDFLILFPAFPIQVSQGSGETLGRYWRVRNAVTGIGISPFDGGTEFGSASRLKGVIDVHSLVPGIDAPGVDAALGLVAHEVAHQWSARVRFRERGTGNPSAALLGRDGAHWSYFLDSEASILYGSDWRDLGGGRFVADPSPRRYSALDLYLMGVLDGSEVPSFSLLAPAAGAPSDATALPAGAGTIISATSVPVSIADIVAVEGPRVPDASASQKVFRAGFAVVTPTGVAPTADQLALVDQVRREWANRFFFMTRGRAVMETELVERAPEAVASSPTIAAGVEFLLSSQQPDGSWADSSGLEVRDTQLALEALAGVRGSPRVVAAVGDGGSFLAGRSISGADTCARVRLGASAASALLTAVAPSCFSTSWLDANGGVAPAAGYRATILDTALTALALDVTERDPTRAGIEGYLLAQQNGDGGWPYLAGGPSQIEPTAAVLRFLASARRTQAVVAAAQAANYFLATRRDVSLDGYGDLEADPGLTAQVVLALAAWSPLEAAAASGYARYLFSVQRPDGSWGSSVAETALVVRVLRELLTPNVAVGPIAISSSAATEGETVLASVQLENAGRLPVAIVTVQAFDGAARPFGPPVTVAQLGSGERRQVSLPLDTSGHGGATELFVVVDPAGVLEESSKADNRVGLSFVVGAPAQGPDVFVVPGSLVAGPAQIERVPSSLTLAGTVGNLGLSDAAQVLVEARVRGVAAGSVRVDLPARTRVPVSIPLTIGAGAADVPIELVVDPLGEVADVRRENNTAQIVVPLVPTIDLRVAELAVRPTELDQGAELQVTYVLANTGTALAQAAVELRVTDSAGRVVAVQLEPSVPVPAGASVARTTHWRAVVAGPVTVTVTASHPADRNPLDNQASAGAVVRASPRPNLVIRAADLVASPDPGLEGQPVSLSATVRNVGGGPTGPFGVEFWLGVPETGTLLGRQTSAGLAGAGEWTTSISIPLSGASDLTVTAVVDRDGAVDELEESDNVAARAVAVRSLPNLAVDSGALVLSTAFPRPGQAVAVDVTVRNLGGQASAATSIELRWAPADGPEQVVASAPVASVAGGASQTASFSWVAGARGAGRLAAVVNPGRVAAESRYDDDRVEHPVLIQDGTVAVTNPYFSPNGDGVKDDTEVFWRAAPGTEVTVQIAPERGGIPVRLLKGTRGSVVWDGKDEAGRVVRDGRYGLSATSGSAWIGSATVTVDTNRSPVQDAPRALLETERVNALVSDDPGYDGRILPDDSGIVFTACGPVQADGAPRCGLQLQRFDGTQPLYLNARAHSFALSPDGSAVAYVADGCSGSTSSGAGCVSLHLVSIPGGEDREVWEAPGSSLGYFELYSPVFSPDGRRVAFVLGFNPEFGAPTVEAVGIDGLEHRVLASASDFQRLGVARYRFEPCELAYSPDGAWVAASDRDSALVAVRDGRSDQVLLFDGVGQDSWFDSWEADGSDRQAWLAGGSEIAYAVKDGIVGIDVVTGAVRAIVSSGAIDVPDPEFFHRGKLARDPYGEALVFPAAPAGDGSPTGHHRLMLTTPVGAPPVTLWEAPVADSPIDQVVWSPSGASIAVGQWASREHGLTFERYVVQTLANLGTRFAASQAPGTRRITFRGTATDLNFGRYEIRTRALRDGEPPRTVVSSSSSVVNGELGTWTPPSPGVYEAALVAFDQAGNVRERRVRFTWGDTPPVVNVRREPEFISPNGDGIQDEAVVSYAVVAPVTVTLTVKTEAGAVVRMLQRAHAAAEETALVWDGRDDEGVLVPDGIYWLEIAGSRLRVVVDTVRPEIQFALRDLGGHAFSAKMLQVYPHNTECAVVESPGDPELDVPQEFANATLSVKDDNLRRWAIEIREGGVLAGGTSGIEQGIQRFKFAVNQVGGRTFQVVAHDRAGNPATSAEESYDEKLFLLGVGNERLMDFCTKYGRLETGYEIYPGLYWELQAFSAGSPPVRWSPVPGFRGLLVYSHTLREPIVSLAVASRPAGHLSEPYAFDYEVEDWFGHSALWLPRNPPGRYEYVLVATDASGHVHWSEPALMEHVGNALACFAGPDRADVRVLITGLPSEDVGVASDQGELEILRADSGSVEVRKSAAELRWYPAAGVKTTFAFDASPLQSCKYRLRFSGRFTNGDPLVRETSVDICGAFVRDLRVSGSTAYVTLGETFRPPLAGVSVHTPGPTGVAYSVETPVTPFEKVSPPVALDLAGRPLCAEMQLNLVARLADGTVVNEADHPGFMLCDDPPPPQVPCARVHVDHWVRRDATAGCSGQASTLQVPISGASTHPLVALDVRLLSVAGVPLASLPFTGFVAGERKLSALASVPIDALPPGRYLVSAEVTDDAGFKASDVTAPLDAIVVDHVAPAVSLISPRSGATLCTAQVTGRDGTGRSFVDLVGSATDEHLDYTFAEVKAPGRDGFSPGERVTPNAPTFSGSFAHVEVVPGADYTVRLVARDATGNEACTPEAAFHVAGPLHLTNLAAAPALFSPDRDGILDQTTLSFESDEAAEVRVVAHLPGDQTAELARRTVVAGTATLPWDGSVGAGLTLPEGRVPIEVIARNACGQGAQALLEVDVDTRPPDVKISFPVAGARASADLPVSGSISDAHLERWTVALAPAGGQAFTPIAQGTEVAWGLLATIPVRDLAAGAYLVRVEAIDRVGHAYHVDVPFEVVAGAIVERFVVSPALVSPNGDGRFDAATASLTLLQAASVTLSIVDAGGAVVATPVSGASLPAGITSVRLDEALAAIRADGDYVVRASGTVAGSTETAVAPLTLDRSGPAVEVVAPGARACIAGPLEIVGTINDPHLRAWTAALRTPGAPDSVVASATTEMRGTIAIVAPPVEGAHQLLLHADDLVGNVADRAIPFIADRTAPELALVSPGDAAWVSGLSAPVEVRAEVSDRNLVDWTMSVLDANGNAQPLATGQAGGIASAAWDAAVAPEIATTLVAVARDCAGTVTRREVRVMVDHTRPTAILAQPGTPYVRSGPLTFVGTAGDANLDGWKLELAQGPASAAIGWVAVATGTQPVLEAALGELVSLPADGLYTVRLTVRDLAGNEATAEATFLVDTKPPAPPVLAGTVRRPSDAILTWPASPEADVVGYRVLRARGAGDLEVATPTLLSLPRWEDLALQDGTWRYAVLAVDAAGLESAPSNVVALTVDATPPQVAIVAPSARAVVSGLVDVVGTAFSIDDFKEYRLSLGEGAAPTAFTALARSRVPVRHGVLASLDSAVLAEGSTYTLRLEAEDLSGNAAAVTVTFAVDNLAPPAPVLTSAEALGRDVTLTWLPVSAPDLAGYLLYRDGVPIGVPAGAIADPRPYLLAPGLTTFVDAGVPDGTFTYQVQAYDLAANPSPLSNPIAVTVDLRAPVARVVDPVHLARLSGVVAVTAEADDHDVAVVQFEVRSGGQGAFQPLGAPVTRPPWAVRCDPRALPSPVLELRAVATDVGGRTDPTPEAVVAFFDPPVADPEVAASTQRHDVEVRWAERDLARVAGFTVRADGALALPSANRPAGVASASSVSYGADPAAAYDGAPNTRWIAGDRAPQWWKLELAARTLVQGVAVTIAYGPSTYDVAVRVRGAWVPLARGRQAPDSGGTITVPVSPPLEIEAVRIDFTGGASAPGLAEVTLSPVTITTATAFVHAGASLGVHAYDVVAMTPFGRTATGKTRAFVYQPTLDAPPAVVASGPVSITGFGVPARSEVALSDGTSVVARAVAAPDGRFALTVPLQTGPNTLTADAVDPGGNRSVPSEPVTVTLEPPPATQVRLSLEAIVGSDVSLAFTPTLMTSDVRGFTVSRDSGDGFRVVASLPADARATVDRGLRNGTYIYRVAAVNARGFAGPPSNLVTAYVAAPVPVAPVLAVSAPPEGRSLQLDWTFAGSSAVTFVVEREATAGSGLFDRIASRITSRSHRDTGLTNGLEYRYRVTAVDAYGNPSPSNVASGVPVDGSAPAAPRLIEPTVPGAPITVAEQAGTLAGWAELGVTVELSQNGRFAGTTRANGLGVEASPFGLAFPAMSMIDAPPGAGRITYLFTGAAGDVRIAIQDLTSGQAFDLPLPAGLNIWAGPYLAPSGDRVAFVAADARAGNRWNVWVGDIASTQVHLADLDPSLGAATVAWSPDGARLAYTESVTGALVVADGNGDGRRVCPGQSLGSVRWISATEIGGIARGSTATLVACETDTSSARTVASSDRIADWSAGEGAVAMIVADASGQAWVEVIDQGGIARRLGDGSDATVPTFAPDASKVAWFSGGILHLADTTGGTRRSTGYRGVDRRIAWPSSTLLLDLPASGSGVPSRLALQGRFDAPVTLDPGENAFAAIAIDDAGHRSPWSEQILVRLDSGQLPDLSVEAQVQPAVAVAASSANAIVTVRNLGAAASAPADLEAAFVVSTGEIRTARTRVPSIAPGGRVTAALPLDLKRLAGSYVLSVVVDPSGVLSDRDRENNRVRAPFFVAPEARVRLDLAAVPPSVACDGSLIARARIANPGGARAGSLLVSIVDAEGVPVVAAPARTVVLPGGGLLAVDVPVPVGVTLAGDYRVVAVLGGGEGVLATASAPVTIEPERVVALRVVSTRATYSAEENVELEAVVANDSRNAPLSGAAIRFEVVDVQGVIRAVIPGRPLPSVWMGGGVAVGTMVPSGLLAAGQYLGRAVVELGGTPLAAATASFTVAADPLLAGRLAVAGAGDPPAVRSGAPVAVTAALRNVGTGAALGVGAELVVLGPDGAVVTRTALGVGDVAPSATETVAVSMASSALPLGMYGLALVARYDGRTETLATARFRVADGLPPALIVTTPAEGAFVRSVVTPVVSAVDVGSGTSAVRVTVDGGAPVALALRSGGALDGAWSGTVPLVGEGSHTLQFSAVDVEGNDGLTAAVTGNPVVLHLVTDTTPPVLTISGVEAGACYGAPPVPVIQATDTHLSTRYVTLDGEPFASGTPVSAEGDHGLVAQAFDLAGNVATGGVRFAVDRTPPRLGIAGVIDGSFVATNVAYAVTADDAHLTALGVTVDGVSTTTAGVATAEGAHQLVARAADCGGNTAEAAVTFTIDRIAPTVAISGVTEGSYVRGPATPTWTVTDANLASVIGALNGAPFASGTSISSDGNYLVEVVGTDRAGNRTPGSVAFVIDASPPEIEISGFVDGSHLSSAVHPAYTATDANLAHAEATLDGGPFVDGMVATAEGIHHFVVTAVDRAGNSSTREAHFTIDRTPPVITLTGFREGSVVSGIVTVGYTVTDSDPGSVTALLDRRPFASGAEVSAEGAHAIVVRAIDLAGNVAEAHGRFTIDDTPPHVVISGVVEGQVTSRTVAPVVTIEDANLVTSTITLDDAAFTSGGVVSAEGDHAVAASGCDAAGLTTSATVRFSIDRTPPRVSIAGVADGGTYASGVAPTIEVADAHLTSARITLDGAAFVSGTPVLAAGPHVLAVTAQDAAGNSSSSVVSFTVDGDVSCPAPETLGPFVPVYQDALMNCFEVSSYWSGYDLASTAVVHGGTRSIAFDPQDWAALRLERTGLRSSYGALEFWVNGGAAGGQRIVLEARSGDDRVAGDVELATLLGGAIPAETWSRVTVPFRMPTAADDLSIWFKMDGKQGAVYFDDIALLAETAGSCSGTTEQPCSDGNACNGLERCDGAGTCIRGVPPAIDDRNPCTDETCDPVAGVSHVPSEVGRSCFVDRMCGAFGACDGAGACLPTSAVRDVRIYDDAIGVCFEDFSVSTAYDPNQLEVSHAGARAIRFAPLAREQVVFVAKALGASFDAIELWIHGGALGGQALSVHAEDASGALYDGLLTDVLGGPITAGTWERVRIPLARASQPGWIYLGFQAVESGGAVYLDDIRFVRTSP